MSEKEEQKGRRPKWNSGRILKCTKGGKKEAHQRDQVEIGQNSSKGDWGDLRSPAGGKRNVPH